MSSKILCSLLIVLFFVGCQKEFTTDVIDNTPTPTPNPLTDSIYLDKVVVLEIENGVTDTFEIWNYTYDLQKRVTSFRVTYPDNSGGFKENTFYTYVGGDSLPIKSLQVAYDTFPATQSISAIDTITIFHTYNTSRKKVQDSIVIRDFFSNNLEYAVKNYSYASNKIFAHFSTTSFNFPTEETRDTATIGADGNISQAVRYRMGLNGWELYSTSTFTYDNKPSPFKILSNYLSFDLIPSGETFFRDLPQLNNRLTQIESLNSSGSFSPFNYSYQNTYRTNGLIKESIAFDPLFPSETEKLIFT